MSMPNTIDLSKKLKAICDPLVSKPQLLSVTLVEDNRKTQSYLVELDESDLGKILGRHGIISDSLRTLVNIALRGSKKKASITFEANPER